MMGPVAIDANLLLLLIVGSTKRDYIIAHKRLRNYTPEDFDLLVDMLGQFASIVLLPNTLTEISNLLRHISDPAKSSIALTMRTFVGVSMEQFVASSAAVSRPEFIRLGLTDAALLEFASIKTDGLPPTLLTADLDLAVEAEMKGYSVKNFNHYRDAEP